MVFNSLQYLVFFPLVFVIYWQLKRRGQNILLLAASWFVALPIAVLLVVFVVAVFAAALAES